MTELRNGEWDRWQAAWQGAAQDAQPLRLAELERRWRRHRRSAWLYTALDAIAVIAFCVTSVVVAVRNPSLPIYVWAVSVVAFSLVGAGFALWTRRDALFVSAEPTADFLARLQLRLARRTRLYRFVVGFVIVEIAYGIAFFAIWVPGSIVVAALIYAGTVPPLAAWGWWHRRRLARERSQLDVLAER